MFKLLITLPAFIALDIGHAALSWFLLLQMSHCFLKLLSLQQIDELLAGSLTLEDEDAVLAELEAITQVWAPLPVIHLYHRSLVRRSMCLIQRFSLSVLAREKI